MSSVPSRRAFLRSSAAYSLGLAAAGAAAPLLADKPDGQTEQDAEPWFRISLGEYSLHRMIGRGKLDHLDFAPFTKQEFGIEAVEYWTGPFQKKATDAKYLAEMIRRADDAGVLSLLILVDGEGKLGDPDEQARTTAVENHLKWVAAAKTLGCHSIRVNAGSKGSYQEQRDLCVDGLGRLSEFAASHEINVIVENHGGLSSNGKWLAEVMRQVDLPNCGTLPDFGNFYKYDRYQGVEELMPFAKAVSAKSHDFDDDGNETKTDFRRMMKIVRDADYRGWVGIEYEGGRLPEREGILATKKLLELTRGELA